MKKFSRYLPSLIVTVFYVFSLLACLGTAVAYINISEKRILSQVRENDIAGVVMNQIDKYFSGRSGSTHVPADVYMNAITEDEIEKRIEERIRNGFAELSGSTSQIQNDSITELDKSIEQFYRNYAAENNITDAEKVEAAVKSAKDNAYNVLAEQCDVYKFAALKEHGILNTASKVYRHLGLMLAAAVASAVILALILLLINRKERSAFLYWSGTAAVIGGLLGAVPCIYLLASRYFYAFSIKQQQVFESYTGSMTAFTKAFLSVSIACTVLGIALLIVYGVVSSVNRSVAPTDLSKS